MKSQLSQQEIITAYLSGKSMKEVGNMAGVRTETIRKRLVKSNTPRRKTGEIRGRHNLSVDFTYFNHIDSFEKAYWLGFLYADGCIRKFATKLKLKDKEPILAFKKAIKSEHKLCENNYHDKRTNKNYKSYTLIVCSQEFSYYLSRFGLGSHKSNYSFPDIDERFYSHFIRGIFDGDGCIAFVHKKCNKCFSSIIISESMRNFIFPYLQTKLGIAVRKHRKMPIKTLGYNLYECHIGSPSIKFLDYIYENSTEDTRLNRKYQKYLLYKEYLLSDKGVIAIHNRRCRKN